MSDFGYRHQLVGKKVSQVQAVLVRRCASIGELQQHLLRAGWQRGVAQWGFIGHSGQWAAIAGFDGRSDDESDTLSLHERSFARQTTSSSKPPLPNHRRLSADLEDVKEHEPLKQSLESLDDLILPAASLPTKANVLVRKRDGGGIFVDDPSRLAEWSVEAMTLIRRYLYRAGNGSVALPYQSNWDKGRLPTWVKQVPRGDPGAPPQLTISNLSLLVAEVEELVDIMEGVMDIQRKRRLDKMKPPSWWRQNWYVYGPVIPFFGGVCLWMWRNESGRAFFRSLASRVYFFFKEHVGDPIRSM